MATPRDPQASFSACASAASKTAGYTRRFDSHDCTLPNKELVAEWIETYGIDSDFVRVRVRGLPPAADELQFIDRERIKEAQTRAWTTIRWSAVWTPRAVEQPGNVAVFRRGGDVRSITRIRIPGEHTRDRNVL
jgi:hypothetical protein